MIQITRAFNFKDTGAPSLYLSGITDSTQVAIGLDETHILVPWRSVSSTYYKFNLTEAELQNLYKAFPNSYTGKIKYLAKDAEGTVSLQRTFTIEDDYPIRITVNLTDTNENTFNLTREGEDDGTSAVIKGYSNIKYTITATNNYGATIKSYQAILYDNNDRAVKTLSNATGTFAAAQFGDFTFIVEDSRGRIVIENLTLDVIDYYPPQLTLSNVDMDVNGNLSFTTSGRYFNGTTFADGSHNKLTIHYEVINNSGTTLKKGTTNSFGDITLDGISYIYSYIVQVYASDLVDSTNIKMEKTKARSPLFSWNNEDFRFNIPVIVNGSISSENGLIGEIVNGTIDTSVSLGTTTKAAGSIELPKGVWIITTRVALDGTVSANTTLRWNLATTSAATAVNNSTYAANGQHLVSNGSSIFNLSGKNKYYLNVRISTGTKKLSNKSQIVAVRIA